MLLLLLCFFCGGGAPFVNPVENEIILLVLLADEYHNQVFFVVQGKFSF